LDHPPRAVSRLRPRRQPARSRADSRRHPRPRRPVLCPDAAAHIDAPPRPRERGSSERL